MPSLHLLILRDSPDASLRFALPIPLARIALATALPWCNRKNISKLEPRGEMKGSVGIGRVGKPKKWVHISCVSQVWFLKLVETLALQDSGGCGIPGLLARGIGRSLRA
eukprot:3969691-Amphidinium_carterae.1